MLKTIHLSGQDIQLRTSAATPIFYRSQFNRDFVADMMQLAKTGEALNQGNFGSSDIDFETLYRLIWICAYTANRDIPDMETWLDQFDDMPLEEVMTPVTDMVNQLFRSTKKSPAPAKKKRP